AEVSGEVVAWAKARLAQEPRLVVDTATDGLEVAARLAADGLPVAGSRALRDAARRIGKLAPLPALHAKQPCITVLVTREARELPKVPVAFVSPHEHGRRATVFPWPFVADRAQLVRWIEQTGARDVYLTGAHAEALAAAVGARAKVLGPPTQMSLFRA
ncbi:MAG: hypothetical protein ACM31C_28115, partial [Acidobacteriota bacterium]